MADAKTARKAAAADDWVTLHSEVEAMHLRDVYSDMAAVGAVRTLVHLPVNFAEPERVSGVFKRAAGACLLQLRRRWVRLGLAPDEHCTELRVEEEDGQQGCGRRCTVLVGGRRVFGPFAPEWRWSSPPAAGVYAVTLPPPTHGDDLDWVGLRGEPCTDGWFGVICCPEGYVDYRRGEGGVWQCQRSDDEDDPGVGLDSEPKPPRGWTHDAGSTWPRPAARRRVLDA